MLFAPGAGSAGVVTGKVFEYVAAGRPVLADERDDLGSIFAVSHQLAFDPEGRVMLPEDLLGHASISELAVFAGYGSTFQIWEPQALDRHLSEARDRIRIQRTTLPTARPEGNGK